MAKQRARDYSRGAINMRARGCKKCKSSLCDGSLKGYSQLKKEAQRLVKDRRSQRRKKPATPKKDPVTPRRAQKRALKPSGQTNKIRKHFGRCPQFKAFAVDEEAIKVRARGLCPCCGTPGFIAEHCHESGKFRGPSCPKFNAVERESVRDARNHYGMSRSDGEVSYDDKPCLFRYLHAAGIEHRTGLSFETAYDYVTFTWVEEYTQYFKP